MPYVIAPSFPGSPPLFFVDESDQNPYCSKRKFNLTFNKMEPHRGTLILILGILGLVVCMPFGIAAWIMGNGDLKKIAAGQMDPEGEGLTKAGKICGIITVVLYILVAVVIGLLVVLSGSSVDLKL